ncbi:hypothetical protein QJQ45_018481, partial [Haematococcus lacustris]
EQVCQPQRVRGRLEGCRVLRMAAGPFCSGAVDDAGRERLQLYQQQHPLLPPPQADVAAFVEACSTALLARKQRHPHHGLVLVHDHTSPAGRSLDAQLIAQPSLQVKFLGETLWVPVEPLDPGPPPGAVKVVIHHNSPLASKVGLVAALLRAVGYEVAALSNMASLALGQMSGWGVTRDGRSLCWGCDDMGSLGQGEGQWQHAPIKLPKEHPHLPRVKAVSVGWKHTCAISSDGRAFTWGWAGATYSGHDGGGGQLGLGDGRDKWAPSQVLRLYTNAQRFYDLRMSYVKPWKVLQISAGRNHTAMVIQTELDMRDVA